ncbi:MAG: leucine-rich repeat domain-containing protein, partial [Bacteroidaceae bacterium]|nr:leucine-rich repeat domain-containing protein [Bacteroidaceae bacterium]
SVFRECSGLTSVTIPNSVTSIGNHAFINCSSLTNVTIPNCVTNIGYASFAYCSGLTSVEIPNSVTSIGEYAFYNCSSITSVELSNSVTNIGECAFYNCSSLTSVTIPNCVTSIGYGSFAYCSSLTSVEIPNSVTNIGEYAFAYCSGLTSIEIPNNATNIGEYAFEYCTGLTSIYLEGATPPTIASNTFEGTDYTSTLYVPRGASGAYKSADYWGNFTNIVEYILNTGDVFEVDGIHYRVTSADDLTAEVIRVEAGYSACSGPVAIPATVTYMGTTYSVTGIGGDAFSGCTALTGIEIPASVTTLNVNAFSGCVALEDIYMTGSTPPTLVGGSFADSRLANVVIHVPEGSVTAYQAADTWGSAENIIEYDVTDVNGVETDEFEVKISAAGLLLEGCDGRLVTVYSMNGALVHKYDSYAGEEIALDKGVYIVRVGGKTVKVKL